MTVGPFQCFDSEAPNATILITQCLYSGLTEPRTSVRCFDLEQHDFRLNENQQFENGEFGRHFHCSLKE